MKKTEAKQLKKRIDSGESIYLTNAYDEAFIYKGYSGYYNATFNGCTLISLKTFKAFIARLTELISKHKLIIDKQAD